MAKRNKGINLFRAVPSADLPTTQFDFSHKVKFDGDFGKAYPVACIDILPGDTAIVSCQHFSRLAPMPAPVLHDFDCRFHWFFVPTRLLWEDFEDWMTGGRTGTWREDNPDAFPTFNLSEICGPLVDQSLSPTAINGLAVKDMVRGSLWDFLGLNFAEDGTSSPGLLFGTLSATSSPSQTWRFSQFPVLGYLMIFNYFFRDQNVMEEIDIFNVANLSKLLWYGNLWQSSIFDRVNGNAKDCLFSVAYDKDYFTSATLTPQRGPQVFVPIAGSAPVTAKATTAANVQVTHGTAYNTGGVLPSIASLQLENIDGGNSTFIGDITSAPDGFTTKLQGNATLSPSVISQLQLNAELDSATGAAVSDVREAFSLQRFFERMQVVGSRFSEFLRGIWGTHAGDSRLQMPEYLGSWTNPFMINNVSQTAATTETSAQGGYSGNGMSSQYNAPIKKYFPEYGYLYCLYIAMPRNGYQQGVSKLLTRTDWLDFANPYFEHIGEQPIMTSELYFNPAKAENQDSIFGYQSQYASYKFLNSHSHGEFKQSLNFWHANRIFNREPTLSEEFIHFSPDETTNRVFHLMEQPKFYTEIDFDIKMIRQLSAYSTPRLI